MKKSYGYLLSAGAVLIVVLALALVFTEKKAGIVGCTMEAKICPDGTAVGRTGPKCEFAPCPEVSNEKAGLIRVTAPVVNAVISSGLEITGEARGYWYFEASFPVQVYDANNGLLGTAIAQAQGDWMTENFVSFKTTLTFSKPTTDTGYLVFKKDNPSGLPEHDDELRIPVRFDINMSEVRGINLYYYNAELDKDEQGNIMCTKAGLVPVTRTIPLTKTPVQDAVKALLKGELTSLEKAAGLTTEFPLAGVELVSASTRGDTLTLSFKDPLHKTTGGACRAGILWAQIEATTKQFPGVTNVAFSPEDLFQP